MVLSIPENVPLNVIYFILLLGKAKMAIFVSWKRKMEGNSDKDVTMIFFNLGKVKNSN